MIYKFKTKYLRISPRKMRFLTAQFKDKNVNLTLEILQNRPEKSARLILKSLRSALSACKDKGAAEEDLEIKNIMVDDGPRLKRRLIKPRGRADLISKRRSHLTLILKDKRKKRKKVDQKNKI